MEAVEPRLSIVVCSAIPNGEACWSVKCFSLGPNHFSAARTRKPLRTSGWGGKELTSRIDHRYSKDHLIYSQGNPYKFIYRHATQLFRRKCYHAPCWCLYHLDGQKHGVFIQISIKLGKEFLRISSIRKIAVTWIFAGVFVYLPYFFSQILDFIYGRLLFLFWSILNSVTLKTSNKKQRRVPTWWLVLAL